MEMIVVQFTAYCYYLCNCVSAGFSVTILIISMSIVNSCMTHLSGVD